MLIKKTNALNLAKLLTPFPDLGDASAEKKRAAATKDDQPNGQLPPADLEQIFEGCAFMRHARDNAKDLSEVDWYAMLSIVSKTADGKAHAHDLSSPYPGYSKEMTDAKFDHAAEASDPVCCDTIRTKTGFRGCQDCPFGRRNNFGRSPILLGTQTIKSGFALTDLGNAERFAAWYRDRLVYVPEVGKWYVWSGRHWRADGSDEVVILVKDMLRKMRADGSAAADWAHKCEEISRVNAMIKLARAHMAVEASIMDRHPFLLSVLNGTIDLRTKEIGPHLPDHYITRLIQVEYFPGMRSEAWDKFLRHLTKEDREYAAFLQVACGYTITGSVAEEKLFVMHGTGGSGKSTFGKVIKDILQQYGKSTDHETFAKNDRSIRNDIAALSGARMVLVDEWPSKEPIEEALVKRCTGRSTITARFLNKEYFEFEPQFKLWIMCNDRPKIRATDSGMWRRLIVMHCSNKAAKADTTLKDRLATKDVQSAVLSWLVDGAAKWFAEGLKIPATIERHSMEYQSAMNPLSKWFAERCVLGKDEKMPIAAARLNYEAYCREIEEDPISKLGFRQILEEMGYEPGSGRIDGVYCRLWRGIGLKPFKSDGQTTV